MPTTGFRQEFSGVFRRRWASKGGSFINSDFLIPQENEMARFEEKWGE
jgi:hypothetical protein